MTEYVRAPREVWRSIYDELKQRGLSLKKIKRIIGCDFSHAVYKGYGIRRSSFMKLEELLGRRVAGVEHTGHDFAVEVNGDLAELVGVILGDGNLDRNTVTITIGTRMGIQYLDHVRELILSVLPGHHVGEYERRGNSTDLKIHSKEFVELLVGYGLQRGDKKANQVGVPAWILSNHDYSRRCFAGLLDTDGSIYRNTRDGQIIVEIKNDSQPILEFSRKFCESLGVRINVYLRNAVIYRQEDVRTLLTDVNPFKLRLERPSPSLDGEELSRFLGDGTTLRSEGVVWDATSP